MLPRERVFAALEHREPDRIPWGEHSIDCNVYEDVLGRPTLVQAKMRETQACWDGRRDEVVESYKRDRLDLIRALEMDIVLNISGYVPPTVQSLQEQIDKLEDQPPGDPSDSAWELVRHAVKQMKKTHFIMLLAGDVSWPTFGATEEEGWMNLVLQPEVCAKLAELQGRSVARDVQLFAKLGVDGIMPCGDLGSSTGLMASPEIYRRMVYPWQKAHVAEAHRLGLKVLKHCCGHVWPIIDELAEIYDAYEAIQATAGMDIARLKERVGRKLCLWGGIWHEHIILGSVEDIRSDARYAFTHAAPGGGYIMGSTHSLAVDAKPANILEMKRCRDEWGSYPIRPERFRP